jgi:hypothetical protein
MRRSANGPILVAGLTACLLAACAAGGATSPGTGVTSPMTSPARPASSMPLSISNGTTIPVTLAVNGDVIETVAPGGYQDPIAAPLPGLPWAVETRSPSGRVLSTLTVFAGDVAYTTPDASGHSSAQGRAVRVDLSCGRLDVWSGPPMLGPAFVPGPSGDCD